MIRIKDIAELAGVSPTTVSNVIHGNTKKVSADVINKVQKILDDTGYVPSMSAMMLANNKSRIVGVVLGYSRAHEHSAIQDPFINTFLGTIEECAEDENYFMMIIPGRDTRQIITTAQKWNVAGLIVIGLYEQHHIELKQKLKRPIVAIDTYMEEKNNIPTVRIDDYAGGCLIAQYLISQGYPKALFVAENATYGDHFRWLGFKNTMIDKTGQCGDERRVLMEKGTEISQSVFQKKLPLFREAGALAVASDYFAIKIMNILYDMGVNVPDEISVTGFDDITNAVIVRPKLTTVRQNIPKKAKVAFYQLMKLVNGEQLENIQVVLPVELIERDTVKKKNR